MGKKIEVNCETGEQVILDMTPEELAIAEANALIYKQREEEELRQKQIQDEIKASALAKLAKLGLTEDEAKAIVG